MSCPVARNSRTRVEQAVLWFLRNRARVVLVAALLGVVAVPRTALTYAALRSDLEELLPRSAPSVAALEELRARLPGMRYLGVVVDTSGPEHVPAALRFIDDLAARIQTYPPDLAEGVRTGIREEREFVETYALQLMDLEDVREIRRAIEERRDWEVTQALDLNLLGEEEDPPPELPIARLRAKYEDRYGVAQSFPGDRFVDEAGRTAVLVIHSSSTSTGAGPDRDLIRRVKADIAELGFPEAYAPGMRLGLAGDVAARVEEMSGLQVDLTLASAIVLVLISWLLTSYFGSVWVLLVLGLPLLLGASYAFALVALPPWSIRGLNSNTAFLGSIVLGNGINSGIILLSRIQEERSFGHALEGAIVKGVAGTWRPTLAASGAAAAAYGSLIFTDFRGFNQFGWIGGFGMILCWIVAMTVTPVALSYWGHRIPIPDRKVDRSRGRALLLGLLNRPRAVLVTTLALCVLSGLGIEDRMGTWMEYDFSKLRRRDSWVSGERYWGPRMNETLGRYLTPTVILTHDKNTAELVRERVEALDAQDRAGGLIHSVQTIRDLLRPERAQAAREAAAINELLTPRMMVRIEPHERELVERAVSKPAQAPLTADDLPESLVMGFREYGGRLDRSVLVYPELETGTWQSKPLADFTQDLREAATVDQEPQPVAGSLLLASDITEAMRRDGPRATVAAFGAVLAVCLFAFRVPRGRKSAEAARCAPEETTELDTQLDGRRLARLRQPVWLSSAAVGSILLGVLLMMGLVAWSGERLNFTNFVALPMSFGIGADYAINMLRRWQSEGAQDMRHAFVQTGGAVALCSITTIAGFGSLLVAQNRMLYSFGFIVVAGMLTCLATATLVLPSALRLLGRRREKT